MHEEKDSSTQMPVTVFTLQSIYAQSDDDKLLFQLNSGRMDMLVHNQLFLMCYGNCDVMFASSSSLFEMMDVCILIVMTVWCAWTIHASTFSVCSNSLGIWLMLKLFAICESANVSLSNVFPSSSWFVFENCVGCRQMITQHLQSLNDRYSPLPSQLLLIILIKLLLPTCYSVDCLLSTNADSCTWPRAGENISQELQVHSCIHGQPHHGAI